MSARGTDSQPGAGRTARCGRPRWRAGAWCAASPGRRRRGRPTPVLTSRGGKPVDNRALKPVSRITGDAREDEMEGNLQGVGNILGNLKSMATDMGTEIKRQNDQLDLIQGKVSQI